MRWVMYRFFCVHSSSARLLTNKDSRLHSTTSFTIMSLRLQQKHRVYAYPTRQTRHGYNRCNKRTSISCTCSSLLMYICCKASSSSLLRSRRVLPSSAAKCRSEGRRERRADVKREFRGRIRAFKHNHNERHCNVSVQTCSHVHSRGMRVVVILQHSFKHTLFISSAAWIK